MYPADERREFTRVATQVEVEVQAYGLDAFFGMTEDISIKGIFLRCGKSLPQETECRLYLLPNGRGNDPRIDLRGRVARVRAEGLGIEITEIHGQTSYQELAELIRVAKEKNSA